MMTRGIWAFWMICCVFSAYSARGVADDLAEFKNIEGQYHVLQYNGDHSPTGVLQILGKNNIGVVLSPLNFPDGKSPVSNVPSYSLISPESVTTVVKEGPVLIQTAQMGDREVEIRYENYGDFMIIQGTDCGEGCTANKIVVGRTGSFGSQMSAQDFLKKVQGTYENDSAGGIPAKESTKNLVAMPEYTPGKGIIIAPYCDKEETFCDAGYYVLAFDKVKVWHRNLGGGHQIYDIFVGASGVGLAPTGYYRWEEKIDAKGSKQIVFRNVQYLLPGGAASVCLEHVAHPVAD